jgi:hypothetical protein
MLHAIFTCHEFQVVWHQLLLGFTDFIDWLHICPVSICPDFFANNMTMHTCWGFLAEDLSSTLF